MGAANVNGITAKAAHLLLPRVGPWLATVEVLAESTAAVSGACTVELGGERFKGTAIPGSSGTDAGLATSVRIVGGAGGLKTELPARSYISTPVRLVLQDLVREAGEALSSTIADDLLTTQLDRWTRAAGPADAAIRQLADHLGAAWRVLRDGTVWLGAETYPARDMACTVVQEFPSAGSEELASELATLGPGETFRDRRTEHVEYLLEGVRLRVAVDYQTGGRFRELLERLIRRVMASTNFERTYRGQVVSQNADDTCEVKILETRARVPSTSKVPIRPGLPGCTIRVAGGARCQLVFEDGDAARPVITNWDAATLEELLLEADSVTIDADEILLGDGLQRVLRDGDLVTVPGVGAVVLTLNPAQLPPLVSRVKA